MKFFEIRDDHYVNFDDVRKVELSPSKGGRGFNIEIFFRNSKHSDTYFHCDENTATSLRNLLERR